MASSSFEGPGGVWERLVELTGQTLYTEKQRKPFTIRSIDGDYVTIDVGSTGGRRKFHRDTIAEAHRVARSGTELSPGELKQAGVNSFNLSYISAMLQSVGDR